MSPHVNQIWGFQMNEYRNFTCGQLRASDAGKRVKLAGGYTANAIRQFVLVDLRDHLALPNACLTVRHRCLSRFKTSARNR